jgi:acetyltransferase-like isoleucine patch superfamily enzyme/glycosyltransferase involved in cell wall biosynthesis
MAKTETIEIQKEFASGGGKLAMYQDLVLGERGLLKLIRYECITALCGSMPGAAGLLLRSKLYPKLLGRTGRGVTFGRGVVLRHPGKIEIGDGAVIDDGCVLDAKGQNNRGIRIGDGVFLGRNTILNCKNGDITLEDRANIGSNCTIFSASEVVVGAEELLAAYVYLVGGTHRFDDPAVPVLNQGRESRGIRIGPGGWIGAHVTVFDGVSVGRHAVIGAGSVVNRDVADYAVAAGVPAKVVRQRKPGAVKAGLKNAADRKAAAQSPQSKTASSGRRGEPGILWSPHSKRILYLSMYDPHVPYTGAGARGCQFVNFLARRHAVDLVYMTGSGHPGDPVLEEKFKDRIRGVGETVSIPFSQKGYFLFSKPLYNAAARLLEKNRYDLIFCDYGLAGKYGLKLSRRFGVPFVYASHNVEFRQYLGKAKADFRRWPLVPLVLSAERKAVQQCRLLVAISDDDAAFFSRWTSPDKITVVPQGFDDAVLNPRYKPKKNDPRIVLFFGNYAISTNREAVAAVRDRIADRVLNEFPRVRFRFAGAHPPVELSHPAFEFTGFVESVADLIREADVVISPMTGGWGMPTKVIESLACGKPVVATETGARAVPRKFSRLTVCPIDSFPEAIVRVLRENRPVDSADFEALKDEFRWENRLARLDEAMARLFPGGIP